MLLLLQVSLFYQVIEAFNIPNPFCHYYYDTSAYSTSTSSSSSQSKQCREQYMNTANEAENNNDDDPKLYEYYRPQARNTPQGGDMSYIEQNIRRNAITFKSIRQIGGAECTNDVYARGRNRLEYWYIGKIARTTGTVTLNQGIARMWNMIEEHACRLRPVELGREFGCLEIWCSKKGDTELVMSQAMIDTPDEDFSLMKMEKVVEGSDDVSNKEVGFIAEIVTNRGEGFYIVRDNQGKLMQ